MKRASEYRMMARRALRGRYGAMIGNQLLGGVVALAAVLAANLILLCAGVGAGAAGVLSAGLGIAGLTVAAMTVTLFFAVVLVVSAAFSGGLLHLALLAADGEPDQLSDVFYGFRRLLFLKLLAAALLSALLSLVSVFLFVIAGVLPCLLWLAVMLYLTLSWSMTGFLLADQKDLSVLQAMGLSWRLMRGKHRRLFCLYLSFIGWYVLSELSLGIGMLWLIPYGLCSAACFYRDLQKNCL